VVSIHSKRMDYISNILVEGMATIIMTTSLSGSTSNPSVKRTVELLLLSPMAKANCTLMPARKPRY